MQTQGYVAKHLPLVLAKIVMKFITPRTWRIKHIFEAGCLEHIQPHMCNLGNSLKYACRYGYMDIVNNIINHEPSTDSILNGLAGACRAGNVELVNRFLTYTRIFSEYSFIMACRSGNIFVVELIASVHYISHLYKHGLREACRSGMIPVIRYFIDHDAQYWKDGLLGACRGGHRDVAKLMISYDPMMDCSDAIALCETHGHIELAAMIRELTSPHGIQLSGRKDGKTDEVADDSQHA